MEKRYRGNRPEESKECAAAIPIWKIAGRSDEPNRGANPPPRTFSRVNLSAIQLRWDAAFYHDAGSADVGRRDRHHSGIIRSGFVLVDIPQPANSHFII